MKGLIINGFDSQICLRCRAWTEHFVEKYQRPSKTGKFYPFITKKATCQKCNFKSK